MKTVVKFIINNIVLKVLKQICGDDCAVKREELKKWAMYL